MAITVPAVGDLITASWADSVANTLNTMVYGEATSASTVTLSTTSSFAGLAVVTFTLGSQRRVKISVQTSFSQSATTSVRWTVQAGYNTGSSAVIGSFVGVGTAYDVGKDGGGTTPRSVSGFALGTKLLAAGTYTAYAAVTRPVGGAITDTAGNFYTLVEDIGAT